MEIQDYKKKECHLTEKYQYSGVVTASSPVPACPTCWLWSLPGPFVGCRGAQSAEQPFGSTVCAARRDSLISAFSLRCQQFRSMHRGEKKKPEQGCKMLLPGASGAVQPSRSCLEWESCVRAWSGAGELCLKDRAR